MNVTVRSAPAVVVPTLSISTVTNLSDKTVNGVENTFEALYKLFMFKVATAVLLRR